MASTSEIIYDITCCVLVGLITVAAVIRDERAKRRQKIKDELGDDAQNKH